MCGGTLDGDEPGSQTVALTPGPLSAGLYTADSGTAGSCMLMAQAALPCALLAGGYDDAQADRAAAKDADMRIG